MALLPFWAIFWAGPSLCAAVARLKVVSHSAWTTDGLTKRSFHETPLSEFLRPFKVTCHSSLSPCGVARGAVDMVSATVEADHGASRHCRRVRGCLMKVFSAVWPGHVAQLFVPPSLGTWICWATVAVMSAASPSQVRQRPPWRTQRQPVPRPSSWNSDASVGKRRVRWVRGVLMGASLYEAKARRVFGRSASVPVACCPQP